MAEVPQNPLVTSGVIGDVIDDFIPSFHMTVTYNHDENMHFYNGREFFPYIVTFVFNMYLYDVDSFFTLVMVDPDVPNMGEHLHWLVTDIRGIPSFPKNGRELLRYESPNPIGGIHRYVFALFKQTREDCVTALPRSRDNFNTRIFAAENNLGLPVAAIYFNSQREPAPRRR